jgi:hypothetical protein
VNGLPNNIENKYIRTVYTNCSTPMMKKGYTTMRTMMANLKYLDRTLFMMRRTPNTIAKTEYIIIKILIW